MVACETRFGNHADETVPIGIRFTHDIKNFYITSKYVWEKAFPEKKIVSVEEFDKLSSNMTPRGYAAENYYMIDKRHDAIVFKCGDIYKFEYIKFESYANNEITFDCSY
jgi:hypothetical protein